MGFLVGSASESLSGVTTGSSWVELGMGMGWGVCVWEGSQEEDRALQLFCYGVGDETATAELELEDGRESEDCLLASLASIASGFQGKAASCCPWDKGMGWETEARTFNHSWVRVLPREDFILLISRLPLQRTYFIVITVFWLTSPSLSSPLLLNFKFHLY